MKVYIGYDNFKDRLHHHNGSPPNVDYLRYDGFYQACKEDIDFTEVDVHNLPYTLSPELLDSYFLEIF